MRAETGQLVGPLDLTEPLELQGMVIGDVHVAAGGRLVLHGQVTGSLSVGVGGSAVVYGMVAGSVVNEGGDVEVLGMIGSLIEQAGTTRVGAAAVITGQQ